MHKDIKDAVEHLNKAIASLWNTLETFDGEDDYQLWKVQSIRLEIVESLMSLELLEQES